jgi:hypothetical protein
MGVGPPGTGERAVPYGAAGPGGRGAVPRFTVW